MRIGQYPSPSRSFDDRCGGVALGETGQSMPAGLARFIFVPYSTWCSLASFTYMCEISPSLAELCAGLFNFLDLALLTFLPNHIKVSVKTFLSLVTVIYHLDARYGLHSTAYRTGPPFFFFPSASSTDAIGQEYS